MLDPNAHFRVVYEGRSGRHVSLTRQTEEKAQSMVEMCNRYACQGRFHVEDERDDASAIAA